MGFKEISSNKKLQLNGKGCDTNKKCSDDRVPVELINNEVWEKCPTSDVQFLYGVTFYIKGDPGHMFISTMKKG